VLLIPKGVIYLLEFQQQAGPQQAGGLRPDLDFTGDEAEAREVDYVMFQAMQSDYTDLAWSLVSEQEPVWMVTVEKTPLLLAYDREAVFEVLSEAAR
jgi:hypothetical protein